MDTSKVAKITFDGENDISVVGKLIWKVVQWTPANRKSPPVKATLTSQPAIEELLTQFSVEFSPGVADAIRNLHHAPSTPEFFQTLPTISDEKCWAVYCLYMTNPNHPERYGRLYVGVGSHFIDGVMARKQQYETGESLPVLVDEAMSEGYVINHFGRFCRLPIPPEDDIKKTRTVLKGLEAAFTLAFGAMNLESVDYSLQEYRFWSMDSLDFDSLCTHTPLMEGIHGGQKQFSKQDLDTLASEKAKRATLTKNEYIGQWKRKRREDPVLGPAYWANILAQSRDWKRENPELIKATRARYRDKTKALHKHHCTTCNMDFEDNTHLQIHFASKTHLDRLAGRKSSRKSLNAKKNRAKQKLRKVYYCAVCDVSCPEPSALAKHKTSKRHVNKVAAQLASNEEEDEEDEEDEE